VPNALGLGPTVADSGLLRMPCLAVVRGVPSSPAGAPDHVAENLVQNARALNGRPVTAFT